MHKSIKPEVIKMLIDKYSYSPEVATEITNNVYTILKIIRHEAVKMHIGKIIKGKISGHYIVGKITNIMVKEGIIFYHIKDEKLPHKIWITDTDIISGINKN